MAVILTTCPVTGRAVPTGQHASPPVFEREAFEGARFRCPACHQAHSWSKDKAWLAPGALARSGAASLIETSPAAGD